MNGKSKMLCQALCAAFIIALGATGYAQDDATVPDNSQDNLSDSSHDAAARNSYSNQQDNYNADMTQTLGLGLMIGTMVGPEFKWWFTNGQAVQGGVGFNGPSTAVFADYLFHFVFTDNLRTEFTTAVSPYVGLGAIADWGGGQIFNHDIGNFGFGLRIPLGLEFLPSAAPIGIFGEIVPGLGLSPSTFGFFQADLGGRYYF